MRIHRIYTTYHVVYLMYFAQDTRRDDEETVKTVHAHKLKQWTKASRMPYVTTQKKLICRPAHLVRYLFSFFQFFHHHLLFAHIDSEQQQQQQERKKM